MSNIVDKDNSIYLELLKLLVLAAIIAVLFFMVVYFGGEHLFDKYYLDSEWAADKDMEYMSKLQQKIANE